MGGRDWPAAILPALALAAVLPAAVGVGMATVEARAETGGFFKNLLGGSNGQGEATPSSGPRLYDANDAYCPTVTIRDGGAAVQSFAGGAGDNTRLRHQITFGRISRECARRPDGAVGLRIGVELRALLGPAGASGSFEAPLTLTVKASGRTLETRTRRVRISVPAGAAQGMAALIEDALVVPSPAADDYEIEAALGAPPSKPKGPTVAAGRAKPAVDAAVSEAPVAGQ